MRQAHRFNGKGQPYEGLTRATASGPKWTGKIRLVPEALEEPLRWRKPCRVFVNSMSDLFHEDVRFEFIDRVFAIMALSAKHTYQVLTKRPRRMLDYLKSRSKSIESWENAARAIGYTLKFRGVDGNTYSTCPFPLSNVHLGVSVENREALSRITVLREIPAAVRFVSFEPLLEDLRTFIPPKGATYRCYFCGDFTTTLIVSMRAHPWDFKSRCGRYDGWCGSFLGDDRKPLFDWAIIGGESGPNARPCSVEWIRDIARQCKAAAVPVFCKQLGSYPVTHAGGSRWLRDRKGGDMSEFPEDLRVREFPR